MPGQKAVKTVLSEFTCPDCGEHLKHIVKSGSDGYNFWACSDREKCGAAFFDDDGKPGQKNVKTVLSEFTCPDCGEHLKHIVKSGPDGYNFWACNDRNNCGARFKDADERPGEKLSKVELSQFTCPDCGQFLRHIVKDGPDG
jgi:ssDNA-binding Zn-finger/Zn-ribbon topoisomerase 1